LSVEQAEIIYKLLQETGLDGVGVSVEDRTDLVIRRARNSSMQKFVGAIDDAISKTSDTEELRRLSRKAQREIAPQMIMWF
jgi:hypothetical protein